MEKNINEYNAYILRRINHYKTIIITSNLTSLDLGILIRRLYQLRKLLYVQNIDSNKNIIIEEASQFIEFQEQLLLGRINRANFGRTLSQMCKEYSSLCYVDKDNVLYKKYKNTLKMVKMTKLNHKILSSAIERTIKKIEEIKLLRDNENIK